MSLISNIIKNLYYTKEYPIFLKQYYQILYPLFLGMVMYDNEFKTKEE